MINLTLADLKQISGGDQQNSSIGISAPTILHSYHAFYVCPLVVHIFSTDYEWNGDWTTVRTPILINEIGYGYETSSICGASPKMKVSSLDDI